MLGKEKLFYVLYIEVVFPEGLKHLLMAGWSSLLEDIGWVEAEANGGEEIPPDSEIGNACYLLFHLKANYTT